MRFLIALVLTGLLFPAAALSECKVAPQPKLRSTPLEIETSRGKHKLMVELAVEEQERACGLMQRPRLDPSSGMLFKQRTIGPAWFWMKNTPEPLDMLFLDTDGRVLKIEKQTIPFTTNVYGTSENVAAVLEVLAGTAARLSIEPGDRVIHYWFERPKN
jgi:uncharacterized membrane protein (UPF0127 family)